MEAKMPTRGAPFYVIDIYLYKCFLRYCFLVVDRTLWKVLVTDVRTDHPSKFTVHALTTQPQTLSLQHPSLLVLFVVEEPYCGLRLIEYNNHENYNYCRLNCWGICLWYVIYVGGDVMFKVNIRCHVVNWQWMNVGCWYCRRYDYKRGSFIGLCQYYYLLLELLSSIFLGCLVLIVFDKIWVCFDLDTNLLFGFKWVGVSHLLFVLLSI